MPRGYTLQLYRIVKEIERLTFLGVKASEITQHLQPFVESMLDELQVGQVDSFNSRFYPNEEVVRGIMRRARMSARFSQVSNLTVPTLTTPV